MLSCRMVLSEGCIQGPTPRRCTSCWRYVLHRHLLASCVAFDELCCTASCLLTWTKEHVYVTDRCAAQGNEFLLQRTFLPFVEVLMKGSHPETCKVLGAPLVSLLRCADGRSALFNDAHPCCACHVGTTARLSGLFAQVHPFMSCPSACWCDGRPSLAVSRETRGQALHVLRLAMSHAVRDVAQVLNNSFPGAFR